MMIPFWALSLIYWLHMLASVIWIGSLVALAFLVLPAARRTLSLREYANLTGQVQRRLDPLGWFCLALLVGTGMVQMSANPNYAGFLAIDNRWGVAILLKHLVFLGMVVISAYITWVLLPELRRLALRQARNPNDSGDDPDRQRLFKRERILNQLNLFLGIIVLALTALARAS